MSGWQPIETAPKGQDDRILLWWDSSVYTGFWNSEEGLGMPVNAWVANAEPEFYPPGAPMYWQPEPEPPE